MVFSVYTVLLIAGAAIGLAACAAAAPLDGGVPDAEIDRIAAMLGDRPFAFGPSIEDRAAWEKLGKHKSYAGVVANAEKLLKGPMPELTEQIYLEYTQTGNRTKHYNDVRYARHGRIATLVLAECVENRGRFIPALEAAIESICQEPTWVFNFHDPALENWHGKTIQIDLGSILPAHAMAQAEHMLGGRLSDRVRKRMTTTCRQRILDPYRQEILGQTKARGLWWITNVNNWNAVCHAGVLGTALVFGEDKRDRAFFAAAAAKFSRRYLQSFGKDAYCQEGLGYWGYGFGNYIMLCELLYQATGGKLDLYQDPDVREVALVPVRDQITNGVWPSYADSAVGAVPSAQLMGFLNRRYGLGLQQWQVEDQTTAGGGLPTAMMFSSPNSATAQELANQAKEYYELRTYFAANQVLNLRPAKGSACRMAVSIKGGNNEEPHGHTDMGTFVVVMGKEPVILDPGLEVYTARTFSENRFKSNLLNSFGHPVPRVAGQLQTPGRQYHATILSTQFADAGDTCVMDIKPAYSVPALTKLTRTFAYDRSAEGQFTVTDEVAFSTPQQYGTALITYGQWKQQADGSLLLWQNKEAVKVVIDSNGAAFTVTPETIQEDNGKGTKPTRIGIDLAQPVTAARVLLTITPASVSGL